MDGNSHEFTSRLTPRDIIIQPYGLKWSESVWGGTWYTSILVQDNDRCADNPDYTLRFQEGDIRVYHRK